MCAFLGGCHLQPIQTFAPGARLDSHTVAPQRLNFGGIMVNRLSAALSVLVAAGAVAIPAHATAAAKPGCVSASEYYRVARGMSPQRVANLFGTGGTKLLDHTGSYEVPEGNGVTLVTWDRTIVRAYRKCATFDHGRGQIGVKFYETADSYGEGMQVISKVRSGPRDLFPY